MIPEENKRVFLIDDHPVVRQGICNFLSQYSYSICGMAEGYNDLEFDFFKSNAVDLVILDFSLNGESGLKILVKLKKENIPVLIYTMHENLETVQLAFDAGASGYVCKRETENVLLQAVSSVLSGGLYVSPIVAQKLANNLVVAKEATDVGLSQRELSIMILLGEGEPKREIAKILNISNRTVETYCNRIMDKIGVRGMRELRKAAIKNANVLEPEL